MPWIEANGASLRYTLSGSGSKTLVLMHEAGGCLESYDDALPALEKISACCATTSEDLAFPKKCANLLSRAW